MKLSEKIKGMLKCFFAGFPGPAIHDWVMIDITPDEHNHTICTVYNNSEFIASGAINKWAIGRPKPKLRMSYCKICGKSRLNIWHPAQYECHMEPDGGWPRPRHSIF